MKLLIGLVLACVSTLSVAAPITPIESSGTASTYISAPFYMIGIYEPNNEHGWVQDVSGNYTHIRERGQGTVYIEEQTSENVTLALGSYEPTDWKITGPGADNVTQIIVHGYHSATVTGHDVTTAVFYKTYENDPYDYISAIHSWNNSNREAVVGALETIAGKAVTTFTGIYNAESFHIDTN